MINFALKLQKLDLVKFLINTLRLPLTYRVNISEKTYTSALYYCFEYAKKDSTLVDIFSFYIEQDVSLILSVDSDGIPLAHKILNTNPKHPLMSALENTPEKTLDNTRFYTQLINILQNSALPQDKLSKILPDYQQKLNDAKHKKGLFTRQALVAERKLVEHCQSMFEPLLIQQIQSDPDIAAISAQLGKRIRELTIEIKKFQNKYKGINFPFSSIAEQEFNATSEEMLKFSIKSTQDFFEIKAQIVTTCTDQINLCSKISRLLQVQSTIRNKGHVHGRPGRELKRLLKEEQELIRFISAESERLSPKHQLQIAGQLRDKLKESMKELIQNSLFSPDKDIATLSDLGLDSDEINECITQ